MQGTELKFPMAKVGASTMGQVVLFLDFAV